MRLVVTLAVLLLALPVFGQTKSDPESASGFETKPPVRALERMIVTANALATGAGDEIMAAGGSAAGRCDCRTVGPECRRTSVQRNRWWCFRAGFTVRTDLPAGMPANRLLVVRHPNFSWKMGTPLPFLTAVASGRSIGVPGMVRLMETLHQRHGKLPWLDLFQPAIRLARDGFAVSPRLAKLLAAFSERLQISDAAEIFLPDGKPLTSGTILRQPQLAETFETIAVNGANVFLYRVLCRNRL